MKKHFFTILTLLATISLNAEEFPMQEEIAAGDFTRAAEKINKKLANDNTNIEYCYAAYKLYSNPKYEGYNLETAYNMISAAIKYFSSKSDAQRDKYYKKGLGKKAMRDEREALMATALEATIAENTAEAYTHYINFYQEATKEQQASCREHRATLAFEEAKADGTLRAFNYFIETYPSAKEVAAAWAHIYKLEYDNVVKKDIEKSYREYAEKYPSSPFVDDVLDRANTFQFKRETLAGSFDAFKTYILNHPEQTNQCFMAGAALCHHLVLSDDLSMIRFGVKYTRGAEHDTLLTHLHDVMINQTPKNIPIFYNEFPDELPALREKDFRILEVYNNLQSGVSMGYFIEIAAPYRFALLELEKMLLPNLRIKQWADAFKLFAPYADKFAGSAEYNNIYELLSAAEPDEVALTELTEDIEKL